MIRKNSKNKQDDFHKKDFNLAAYIVDNKRIVMPAFLVLCLLVTILVAVHAGRNDNQSEIASDAASDASHEKVSVASAAESSTVDAMEVVMEEDAYPEITALINQFYEAQASGDMDTINSITEGLTEAALIRYEVSADYYEKFDSIKVYTKKGPETGAYVAYVYFELYFNGFDQQVPGLQTYYIRTNEDGEYYLYFGELDEDIINYIEALSVQDDFIDLSNEVAVNYNTMLEENSELSAFLTNFSEEVNKSVGKEVALASAESSESEADSDAASSEDSSSSEESSDDNSDDSTVDSSESQDSSTGSVIIEATTVVKIRSSDSTNADVLGKTEVGQQFIQLEALANGWSKIDYNGQEAYVRTEYFTVVSDESTSTDSTKSDTGSDDTNSESSDETDTSGSSVNSTGTYHVASTVHIRKSASTSSEILGNAYEGDEITVTNYRADGWCEVEYNGITGYVKTEYLTK